MISKENTVQTQNFMHNISWLRKNHRISKKKMAELLNIGIYSLTKIEKGILPPRLGVEVIFAIEYHFGISPAEQLKQKLEYQKLI